MIRDKGPISNIGYGLTSRDVPTSEDERQGPDPRGSFIGRALHDDPILKFFAVGAATMVGMHVAGGLIRKKGGKLLANMAEGSAGMIPRSLQTTLVDDFRRIQRTLDDYEGVVRGPDGTTITHSGYAYNKGAGDSSAWQMRDEIQQRLVRQARRLPYELPAAYLAQKAPGVGTDAIFGSNEERPNWANPTDVLGDFARVSTRNLASYLLPFEAAGAGVKMGWRRILNYGDGVASEKAKQVNSYLSYSLNLVGHKSSDIVYDLMRKANRGSAGIAAGIHDATSRTHGLTFHLRDSYRSVQQQARRDGSLTLRNLEGNLPKGLPQIVGFKEFSKGYKNRVSTFDEEWMHLEAMRTGRKTVQWQGKTIPVDRGKALNARKLSVVEEIAAGIHQYGGRNAANASLGTLKQGQFYDDQMNDQYKRYLKDALNSDRVIKKAGIASEDVDKFVRLLQVRGRPRVGSNNAKMPLSDRIAFGDVMGKTDHQFAGGLGHAMSNVPGLKNGKSLASALPRVIGTADNSFMAHLELNEARVLEQWRTGYTKGIVPAASDRLGQTRLPFEFFHNLDDPDVSDFLLRNTASQVNKEARAQAIIPRTGDAIPLSRLHGPFAGTRAGLDEIAGGLHGYGFDRNNPQQMLNFLIDKKVVAPPSTRKGFNALGMRRMSLEDGLGTGYFGEHTAAVRNLSRDMADFNPISSSEWMRRTPIGDVFQTRSGHILDFTPVTSSFRRVMDSLSENFQIPFIGLSPLQTAGYGADQQTAQTPIFSLAPGGNFQPFAGLKDDATESYFHFRTGRSKGQLQRIVGKADDPYGFSMERIAGEYRNMPPDAHSMLGRHLRLAIGDRGLSPDEPKSGWKKLFNVDENQPKSLRGYINRYKTRETDVRNPAVLARLMLEHNGDVRKIAQATGSSETEVARAFQRNFEQHMRQFQIKPDVLDQFIKSDNPSIKKLFQVESSTGEMRDITAIRGPGDLTAQFKALTDELALISDPDQKKALGRAANLYVWPHIKGARSPRYFEALSSQSMRRRGIFRRFEEAQADLGRFLAVRSAVENKGGFSPIANDLLGELDGLYHAGTITRADYTEARGAVLGLQISYSKISEFSARSGRQQRVTDLMSATGRQPTKGVNPLHDVLQDVADYGMETGIGASLKQSAKKRIGISEYDYPGTEYNPFSGGQEAVFVPTFKTTFKRNPLKAISSVTGLTNWSDPEHFSGSSVPIGHGFQRLNGFMGLMGAQLDETEYGGSLGFYTKGLIGQRVLPLVAGGTAFMAVDRTAGSYLTERDEEGERVYRPLVMGGAANVLANTQIGMAGILPGGQTAAEREEELFNGEVAVRKGRWWPLGNTPWEGGRVSYYRPSWYRRFTSGGNFTEEGLGTPTENLLYGQDFSPLRPLDPYRFERKHMDTRPYPVTGEYFNGPWGPLTSALNSTLGRVLKPPKKMHEAQVDYYLRNAQLVGGSGVATDQSIGTPMVSVAGGGGFGGDPTMGTTADRQLGGGGGFGGGGSGFGGGFGGGVDGSGVGGISAGESRQTLAILNQAYVNAAQNGPSEYTGTNSPYGMMTLPGAFTPQITQGGTPMSPHSLSYQAGDLGYRMQEMMGIYGFAFGAVRSSLGLGNQDMAPERPVFASPSGATSAGQAFWDANLGGLGDAPLPIEGDLANIEISEFVRRFVTRERSSVNEVNPIPNVMGVQYPWLPGSEYYLNFRQGDPYSQVPEGEARLPGTQYRRLHGLHPDATGEYGVLDQMKILGDVAPWSDQYRAVNRMADDYIQNPVDRDMVNEIRRQVEEKSEAQNFTPYVYNNTDYQTKDAKITEMVEPGVFRANGFDTPIKLAGVTPTGSVESDQAMQGLVGQSVRVTYDANRPALTTEFENPINAVVSTSGINFNRKLLNAGLADPDDDTDTFLSAVETPEAMRGVRGLMETIAHRDTYFNTKFMHDRTAVEDWERDSVYGATFPQWQNPIKDYLMPSIYKATNRGPILSAFALGAVGRLFGGTAPARTVGSLVGATAGFGFGLIRGGEEQLHGTRFMPKHRRQEVAVEEYTDILKYVKSIRLRNQAMAAGDDVAASEYTKEAKRTMYGADVRARPEELLAAIPERKRDYFMDMIRAPKNERQRILSTAGRLERRIYESAWGMDVEQRPDLAEYFETRELPTEDWEGWSPDVNMDHVKIKIAQSIGLDVSQMGYYPQQVGAANAVNPAYPDMTPGRRSNDVQARLRMLMYEQGIRGNVRMMNTSTPGIRTQINSGVAA